MLQLEHRGGSDLVQQRAARTVASSDKPTSNLHPCTILLGDSQDRGGVRALLDCDGANPEADLSLIRDKPLRQPCHELVLGDR